MGGVNIFSAAITAAIVKRPLPQTADSSSLTDTDATAVSSSQRVTGTAAGSATQHVNAQPVPGRKTDPKSRKPHAVTSRGVFDDDALFGLPHKAVSREEKSPPKVDASSKPQNTHKPAPVNAASGLKVAGLFSSDDDDDDLFNSKVAVVNKSEPVTSQPKPSIVKIEAAVPNIKQSINDVKKMSVSKHASLFDDSDDDFITSSVSQSTLPSTTVGTTQYAQPSEKKLIARLSDGDIKSVTVSNPSKKDNLAKANVSNSPPSKPSGRSNTAPSSDEQISSKLEHPPPSISLFSSGSDDDLFSPPSSGHQTSLPKEVAPQRLPVGPAQTQHIEEKSSVNNDISSSSDAAKSMDSSRVPVIPIVIDQSFPTNNECIQSRSDFFDSSGDEQILFSPPPGSSKLDISARQSKLFTAISSDEDEAFPSISNAIDYQEESLKVLNDPVANQISHSIQNNENSNISISGKVQSAVEKPLEIVDPKVKFTGVRPDRTDSSKSAVAAQSTNTVITDIQTSSTSRHVSTDSDDLFAETPIITKLTKSDNPEKLNDQKSLSIFSSDDEDIFASPRKIKNKINATSASLLSPQNKDGVSVNLLVEASNISVQSSVRLEKDKLLKTSEVIPSDDEDIFNSFSDDNSFDENVKRPEISAKPVNTVTASNSSYNDRTSELHVTDGNTSSAIAAVNCTSEAAGSSDRDNEPAVGVKKKPLAGSVALFGGAELLAKVEKRRQDLNYESPPKILPKPAVVTTEKIPEKIIARAKPVTTMKPVLTKTREAPFESSDTDDSRSVSPKKKPAGGVALFGGAELFAKLKQRQSKLSFNEDDDCPSNSAASTPSVESKSFPIPSNTDVYEKQTLNDGRSRAAAQLRTAPTLSLETGSSFEQPANVDVLSSLSKVRIVYDYTVFLNRYFIGLSGSYMIN